LKVNIKGGTGGVGGVGVGSCGVSVSSTEEDEIESSKKRAKKGTALLFVTISLDMIFFLANCFANFNY
jgi:hypothetical protein